MRETYDVVVIGSGFGGAIPALRLAEAGSSVAVLEQGARHEPRRFPRTVGQVGRAFFGPDQGAGFLEYRPFRHIDVIQGVGVGGGSLHYFNVNLRPPRRVLERWPTPLPSVDFEPYTQRVLDKLGSAPLHPPAGKAMPPRTEAFLAAARAVGHPELVNLAVYTGERRTSPSGVDQDPCNYCGNCMLGCQVAAKNTLDLTYLREAEQRHGAAIFPLHRVSGIRPDTDRGSGYWVDYEVLAEHRGSAKEHGSVRGERVIVAAGTLGSGELLLRCRDVLRTLPKLGPSLGLGFSGNGDFLFAGALGTSGTIDPAQGPSITAVVDASTADHQIHIEDLGFPDPMLWFLEGMLPPGPNRLLETLGLGARYVAESLGFGRGRTRLDDELGRLLRGGRTNQFLPFLGMGTDAADGQLRLRGAALDIQWRHRRSRRMFAQMEASMRRIAEATGGRYVTSFMWRWPWRKLLTAHPLGGCRMGATADSSVVDHRGQAWYYPGLYVTDGACIPSALGVNPSLTIGGVAERAAFWMVHGREWRPGDPAA